MCLILLEICRTLVRRTRTADTSSKLCWCVSLDCIARQIPPVSFVNVFSQHLGLASRLPFSAYRAAENTHVKDGCDSYAHGMPTRFLVASYHDHDAASDPCFGPLCSFCRYVRYRYHHDAAAADSGWHKHKRIYTWVLCHCAHNTSLSHSTILAALPSHHPCHYQLGARRYRLPLNPIVGCFLWTQVIQESPVKILKLFLSAKNRSVLGG